MPASRDPLRPTQSTSLPALLMTLAATWPTRHEEVVVWAPQPDFRTHLEDEFTLVCWNLAKSASVRAELAELVRSSDIVCTQELLPSLIPDEQRQGVFAPSHTHWLRAEPTGVGTLSRVPHLHAWSARAPWREALALTPKMTLFTRYAWGPDTLLVVNLHGLNFQPHLTRMLRDQLLEVRVQLARHAGPVVVCGDFNTWHPSRLALLDEVLHELVAVEFPEGRPGGAALVRLIGGGTHLPLDHVLVRGLKVVGRPRIHPLTGSDHAALEVRLARLGG